MSEATNAALRRKRASEAEARKHQPQLLAIADQPDQQELVEGALATLVLREDMPQSTLVPVSAVLESFDSLIALTSPSTDIVAAGQSLAVRAQERAKQYAHVRPLGANVFDAR